MPAGITVIHRVVTAIRIEIIRQQITVDTEKGGIVGRDETAYCWVIVTGLQVIPSGFSVVVIATVTNGINVGNADRGVIVRNRASAPGIIVVSCNDGSIGIVDAEDVALCVLSKEILGCCSGVGIVGEADDCAGGIVLIYEVTLRLIPTRSRNSLLLELRKLAGDQFSGEPGS